MAMQLSPIARACLLPACRPASTFAPTQSGSTADQILASETYLSPPSDIQRLVDARRHLNVELSNQSPTRRHFLEQLSGGMPTVKEFGKPAYNLGGLQIDWKANRARTLTTRSGTGYQIIDATTVRSTNVEVPAGASVSGAQWPPDGAQLAFGANFDRASFIYVAGVPTGRSRPNPTTPSLGTFVTQAVWTSNGTQ